MATLNSRLKKGDEVIVITGKDKGKKGKITSVDTQENRVVVAGINQVKKHISQREAMRLQREPGVETKEMPIQVSNVMLADPKTGEPTRVGVKLDEKGNKVRFAKKSGETIDTIKQAKK
ncbi:MAG: 50S ribosomal protein L24 [Alphaproteobacteria bacterium]|nr:50S ribosomal protein L24 [Alphaproteobacteria bacterium]MDD9919518.1 50S ribosomal protein L24 [Alphaproteobacteria bacterium]